MVAERHVLEKSSTTSTKLQPRDGVSQTALQRRGPEITVSTLTPYGTAKNIQIQNGVPAWEAVKSWLTL